jgi:hypothetical protein
MRPPGLTAVDVFMREPLAGDAAVRLAIAVACSVSR